MVNGGSEIVSRNSVWCPGGAYSRLIVYQNARSGRSNWMLCEVEGSAVEARICRNRYVGTVGNEMVETELNLRQ